MTDTALAGTPSTRTLDIAQLRILSEVQIPGRVTDPDTVKRYRESIDYLPPVTVVETETGELILADGFHRVAAHFEEGRTQISAFVRPGTLQDAMEIAAVSNAASGKALTTEQRNEGIKRLKSLNGDYTQEKLSQLMQVSLTTVQRVLAAVEVKKVVMWRPVQENRISDVILAEIHSAPREQWEALCKAYDARQWTRSQIIDVVRTLKSDAPASQKLALLSARSDPGSTVIEIPQRDSDFTSQQPPFELGTPRGGHSSDDDEVELEDFPDPKPGYDPVGRIEERVAGVIVDVNIRAKVDSTVSRKRGEREYRREAEWPPRPYRLLFPEECRSDSALFASQLAQRVESILEYEGWPQRERVWGE